MKILLNSFLTLLSLILSCTAFCSKSGETTMSEPKSTQAMLVLDESFDLKIPRNFRQESSPYLKNDEKEPTREGLNALRYAASGQFSERTLKAVLPKLKGQVWVVDLRRENHGFINGVPVSWYASKNQSNLNLSTEEILVHEKAMLAALPKDTIIVHEVTDKQGGAILASRSIELKPERVESEQQIVERLGLSYIRIPVSDHHRPNDEQVEAYVKLITSLPKDATLYFHCRAGRGRTTTFVALWDMLVNAKNVSFKEIIERHRLMGGAALCSVSDDPEKSWKQPWSKDRKAFLEDFYEYAKHAYPKNLSWAQWIEQQSL